MSDLVLAARDLQLVCEHCNHCFVLTVEEQRYCGHIGVPWPQYCRRCRTTFAAPKLLASSGVTPDRSRALWFAAGALVAVLAVGVGVGVALHMQVPEPAVVTETGTRVTTTYLNLRTGPTTSAQVLGVLDPASELFVRRRVGDWFQVSYRGQEGFVYAAYTALPPARPNERRRGTTCSLIYR